jgi:hypothetical protein
MAMWGLDIAVILGGVIVWLGLVELRKSLDVVSEQIGELRGVLTKNTPPDGDHL